MMMKMLRKLDKEDLISMLDGFGTYWYMRPFMDSGQEKRAELCTFTGDQWNPMWDWRRDKLASLTEDRLWGLYQELKRERSIDLATTEAGVRDNG
jgi:hypothetical protein